MQRAFRVYFSTATWNFLISRACFMDRSRWAQHKKFLFLLLNLNTVLLDFADICQINWKWLRSTLFETVRIHFLSEVLGLLSSRNLLPRHRDVTTPLYIISIMFVSEYFFKQVCPAVSSGKVIQDTLVWRNWMPCSFSVELGSRMPIVIAIPWVELRIPKTRIPDRSNFTVSHNLVLSNSSYCLGC